MFFAQFDGQHLEKHFEIDVLWALSLLSPWARLAQLKRIPRTKNKYGFQKQTLFSIVKHKGFAQFDGQNIEKHMSN